MTIFSAIMHVYYSYNISIILVYVWPHLENTHQVAKSLTIQHRPTFALVRNLPKNVATLVKKNFLRMILK